MSGWCDVIVSCCRISLGLSGFLVSIYFTFMFCTFSWRSRTDVFGIGGSGTVFFRELCLPDEVWRSRYASACSLGYTVENFTLRSSVHELLGLPNTCARWCLLLRYGLTPNTFVLRFSLQTFSFSFILAVFTSTLALATCAFSPTLGTAPSPLQSAPSSSPSPHPRFKCYIILFRIEFSIWWHHNKPFIEHSCLLTRRVSKAHSK
jgi:hypothetical protein